MSNDSIQKTLLVATALCVICSVVVSSAAVLLRPIQAYNQELDKKKNILEAGGLFEEGADIEATFQQIETKIVDLSTGEYTDAVDPATYDDRVAASKPETRTEIPKELDLAGIKKRALFKPVYLVRSEEGIITRIILPVHGKGLWSTLYGFVAMDPDGSTIRRLAFYAHGETPGLGGEVDNRRWIALWDGKKAYGPDFNLQIRVVKGRVDPSLEGSEFKVDGLSGATITSRGVSNLLRYWFGEHGYQSFLKRFQQQTMVGEL